MSQQVLIRLRLPLLLAAFVAVLMASAVPAFAGEDDETTPPPPPVQPTPIPVQPTPAPTVQPPTKSPRELALERELTRAKRENQALEKRVARHEREEREQAQSHAAVQHTAVQPTPVVAQRVQAGQAARTVPRGGVQAGAGGTAPQASGRLPFGLAVAGLLLTLLTFGGAVGLAQVRSRR